MTTQDSGGPASAPDRRSDTGGAVRVAALYLALTLVPLARAVLTGLVSPWLGVAHVAGLAWVLACVAGRVPAASRWRGLAEWTPLLVLPLLYAELPALMGGLWGADLRYRDPLIQSVESTLFGTQPAYRWAGAMPWTLLSETLHLCYLLFYPLIYIPPLLLYLGVTGLRDAEAGAAAFRETILALTLAWAACYLVMIVLPVQGPRYLGVPEGVPGGPIRGLALAVLETGSSRGAAFPSSHVAISVAQAVATLRWQPRRLGRGVAVVTIGVAAGAVYGGFHYGTDALAGALVGLGSGGLAVLWQRRTSGRGPGFTSPLAEA